MNHLKNIAILIKSIILNSWLSFVFFTFLVGLVFVNFDYPLSSHPFVLSSHIAVFLLPPIVLREIFRHYKSNVAAHYAFIWGTILFLMFLFIWGNTLGKNIAELLGFALCGVVILSIPNYCFLKYLAPKKSVRIILSILSIFLLVLFLHAGEYFIN